MKLRDELLNMAGTFGTNLLGGLTENAIASISESIAAKVSKQWLADNLPSSQVDDIRERARQAATLIEEATIIINDLQLELSDRSKELDDLTALIAQKRDDANYWANIASVNEDVAKALTKELENSVRIQLRTELDKGKTQRQVIGVLGWLVALVAGAALGGFFQEYIHNSGVMQLFLSPLSH